MYRIRVPARAHFTITAKPSVGDPDLLVYSGRAKSINQTSMVVASSRRKGAKTEVVRLSNSDRRPRSGYVAVRVSDKTSNLLSTYTLSFKRRKR